MSTVPVPKPRKATKEQPLSLLANGDRIKQPEFHRRYESYPEDVKIELVGGIVHMASPLRVAHSDYDEELGFAFGVYRRATPGIQASRGATTILDEDSEPQPDLGLRLRWEYGGRSRTNAAGYLVGPPELLAEIAFGTRTFDLRQKREDYRRTGVVEYIVVSVEEPELHWFHFRSRRRITPDDAGIYRSRVFPGLWIDGPGLLALNSSRVHRTLRQGLKSPEHAAFVKRIKAAYLKHSKD